MSTKLSTIATGSVAAAVAAATIAVAAVSIAAGSTPPAETERADALAVARAYGGTVTTDPVARGRYLVRTAGCNDCHTPHYMERAGAVPESEWLTGAPIGFLGPWGTTYAANLRLTLAGMDEAQWLVRARQPMRPPMPWFNLRDMNDDDLRAIFAYVRSLPPTGVPAPAYVAAGDTPVTPYFVFVPQNLPPQAQAKPTR